MTRARWTLENDMDESSSLPSVDVLCQSVITTLLLLALARALVGPVRAVGLGRVDEHRVRGRGRGAGVLWAPLRLAKA